MVLTQDELASNIDWFTRFSTPKESYAYFECGRTTNRASEGSGLAFCSLLKALAFVPSLVNRIPRCDLPGHFVEDGVRSCPMPNAQCQMPNAINNAIKLA